MRLVDVACIAIIAFSDPYPEAASMEKPYEIRRMRLRTEGTRKLAYVQTRN